MTVRLLSARAVLGASVAVALLAVAPGETAAAGADAAWRSHGPFGGAVVQLAASQAAPDTVLAVTEQALYRSTDGGSSWRRLHVGPVWGAAFAPSDPRRAYAYSLTWFEVIRSDDGGASWHRTHTSPCCPQGKYLTVDPGDANRLYLVGPHDGLARSDDAGATWTDISDGLPVDENYQTPVASLVIDPSDSRRIYVVGTDGVYRSIDLGAHWHRVLGAEGVQRVAVDPRRPAHLVAMTAYSQAVAWASSDRGSTWRRMDVLPYVGGSTVYQLAYAPVGRPTVYASIDGYGIFASGDGGAHWHSASAGFPGGGGDVRFTIPLLFDPRYPGHLLAGGLANGVKRTTTGGRSWELTNQGLDAVDVTDLAVDPRGPIYAGSYDGLYRSRQDGSSWRLLSNPTSFDHRGALAVASDGTLYSSMGKAIGRSVDGGLHWRQVGAGIGPSWVGSIVVAPSQPSVVYVAAQTLMRSDDRGAHFVASSPKGANPYFPVALAVDPTRPCRVYYSPGLDQRIFRSADCGRHWTAAYDVPDDQHWVTSLSVDARNPRIVYAGRSEGSILRSTDRGRHWSELNGPWAGSYSDFVAVRRAADGLLVAALGNISDFIDEPPPPGDGVYVSDTNGRSWRLLPPLPAVIRTLEIGPGLHGRLLAGTWGHGVLVGPPS